MFARNSLAPAATTSRFARLALPLLVMTSSLGVMTGCAVLKTLIGRNTINLDGAEVQSMSADIRRAQKTICPRARVQMAVSLDVMLKGEQNVSFAETWEGGADSSRNGKLDFSEFAFHSELGSFDGDGWFTPNPDMRASAGQEFQITTVYRRRPDQFTLETSYKPDYGCITSTGKPGAAGEPGSSGASGQDGRSGETGGRETAGGDGADAGSGGDGSDGNDGNDGPRFQAFVTFVATPYYEKLLAVRITGDEADLVLAPPDKTLTIVASGGSGGDGGDGGRGGRGGSGGSGSQGGKGGKGGQGGKGGSGGKGGKGGEVSVMLDARFPELRSLIAVNVSGGLGGRAGSGGGAGDGGSGGSSMAPNSSSGSRGSSGVAGRAGREGSSGVEGKVSFSEGSVTTHFSDLGIASVLQPGSAAAGDARHATRTR